MMTRFSLGFAGVSGAVAVLAGAAASHWLLAAGYGAADIVRVEKAAAWQMYHTLALLAAALLHLHRPRRAFAAAALLFALGILCFSGGLYLRALLAVEQATLLAPLGGMAWMAGWLALGCGGWRLR